MNQLIPLRSEQYLLMSVLMRESTLDELGGVRADQFGHPGHRRVWQRMLDGQATGELDTDAIMAWADDEAPEAVGDALRSAIGHWSAAGLDGDPALHAELVRQKALTRGVLRATANIAQKATSGTLQGASLVADARAELDKLSIDADMDRASWTLADMLKSRFADYDRMATAHASGEHVGGVPTGIRRWDALGGLLYGIVTVLAARPSMGKTAVAQNVVMASLNAGYPVHWISLEEGHQSFTDRLLTRVSQTHVSLTQLARGHANTEQMSGVLRGGTDLVRRWKSLLQFNALPGANAVDAVNHVRATRRRVGWDRPGLVVIDYLQKLGTITAGGADIYTRTVDNIGHLDRSALEDRWAYLVLSQVNSRVEDRKNRRPTIRDLFGGDTIGFFAKQIVSPYRPNYYNDDEPAGLMELNCLKNNEGPDHWRIPLGWDGPRTLAYDLVRGTHCFVCGRDFADQACTHAREDRQQGMYP